MPRLARDVDIFTRLRGYRGQADAIWEYEAPRSADADSIGQLMRQTRSSAVVRTGLGVWRAYAGGLALGTVFANRDAATAAIRAIRCDHTPIAQAV